MCTNFRANPNNPTCASRGSKEVMAVILQELKQKKLPITVEESPCLGFCEIGPNLRLMPNGEFFHSVSDKKISAIIMSTEKFLKD